MLAGDELDRLAERESGAKVSRHSLIFYGACADCLEEEKPLS